MRKPRARPLLNEEPPGSAERHTRHRSAKVSWDVPVLRNPPETFKEGINSFKPDKAKHFPKVSADDCISHLALEKSECLAQEYAVQYSQKEQTGPLNLLQTAMQEPLCSLNLRQP